MKIWLIEIIHNLDMLCNVVFWLMSGMILIGYAKSNNLAVSIGWPFLKIWLIAAVGVLFIPSKAALERLL